MTHSRSGRLWTTFKRLAALRPRIPPTDFAEEAEKEGPKRYKSKMDPFAILAKAKKEMLDSDPEAFKVIILALLCGLRRSEIDNLLWNAFDFTTSELSVEPSEYYALKSEKSSGNIDLDADTLALFNDDHAKHPTSVFVIESKKEPKKSKNRYYRCEKIFVRVLAWLRAQGVESDKPIHTLRKEIGSVINKEYGIYAASRFLRHSNISITADYYLDNKETVVPKLLGGILGKNVPENNDPTEPEVTESDHDPIDDW
jgi:integrase